ncbi:hypothetical protein BGZ63DRAFT_144864 [Mariannaea sp. PMI_226]|nr:hypothetical protein BGZ63DRAFT_144864 [Mariannaea sp. PMI_226]
MPNYMIVWLVAPVRHVVSLLLHTPLPLATFFLVRFSKGPRTSLGIFFLFFRIDFPLFSSFALFFSFYSWIIVYSLLPYPKNKSKHLAGLSTSGVMSSTLERL